MNNAHTPAFKRKDPSEAMLPLTLQVINLDKIPFPTTRFFYKQRFFFDLASVLLNFFMNLLSTYNHHFTETHFIFSIFVSRPTIMDKTFVNFFMF